MWNYGSATGIEAWAKIQHCHIMGPWPTPLSPINRNDLLCRTVVLSTSLSNRTVKYDTLCWL